MEFNPEAYELSEYFAGPPATYHLELPKKLYMNLLVIRHARAARRQPTSVSVQLVRPLNEESCYASITEMDKQDYDKVREDLQGYFDAKNLMVSNLELKHLRKITPPGVMREPFDLVEATFTVGARK